MKTVTDDDYHAYRKVVYCWWLPKVPTLIIRSWYQSIKLSSSYFLTLNESLTFSLPKRMNLCFILHSRDDLTSQDYRSFNEGKYLIGTSMICSTFWSYLTIIIFIMGGASVSIVTIYCHMILLSRISYIIKKSNMTYYSSIKTSGILLLCHACYNVYTLWTWCSLCNS